MIIMPVVPVGSRSDADSGRLKHRDMKFFRDSDIQGMTDLRQAIVAARLGRTEVLGVV